MKRKASFTPPRKAQPAVKKQALVRQDAKVWRIPGPGPEVKNSDVDQSAGIGTTIGAPTWTIAATGLLNGLAQGNSEVTRIGRKVTFTKLSIIWSAQLAPTSTQGCNVRARVFFDRQANGVIPGITDVFATNSFYSPNNLANSDRFVTLADWITPEISAQNNFSVSGRTNINLTKKLNEQTMYTGGGVTIANITSGSIYIVFSQNGNALVAAPTFSYYSRIRYTDA